MLLGNYSCYAGNILASTNYSPKCFFSVIINHKFSFKSVILLKSDVTLGAVCISRNSSEAKRKHVSFFYRHPTAMCSITKSHLTQTWSEKMPSAWRTSVTPITTNLYLINDHMPLAFLFQSKLMLVARLWNILIEFPWLLPLITYQIWYIKSCLRHCA